MKKILIFLILVASLGTVFPQKPQIKFKHLKVHHGLSQSWVKSICQDQQGFMWFGTFDGLNKYDGYNFTVYKHNPKNKNSLSNSLIETMYIDGHADLWIGTENGLNLYNRKNDQFIHHDHWPEGHLTDFLEFDDGRLIIASRYNGI